MHPTKAPYQGFANPDQGGTLGARILPRTGQRLAGASIPWGRFVDFTAGFTTVAAAGLNTPVEVVRASIGGPCAWSVVCSAVIPTVGDTLRIVAFPGLGAGNQAVPVGTVSSVVPMVFFAGPTGIPAGELVVSVFSDNPLAGTARVSITVCPVHWPHWASPQTVNP